MKMLAYENIVSIAILTCERFKADFATRLWCNCDNHATTHIATFYMVEHIYAFAIQFILSIHLILSHR